jgi:hypothetical protein
VLLTLQVLTYQIVTVNWNDTTNPNWLEQFTVIINACIETAAQRFGRPGNSQTILGVQTDEYGH